MNFQFKIDDSSSVPKFQQIVAAIISDIDQGRLVHGQQIPSMNQLQQTLHVSRETVYKAYKELRSRGVIASHPGKGYYVSAIQSTMERNVFVLFDQFTIYKELVFNILKEELGAATTIDIYFHHYNSRVFQSLIRDANRKYTDYVIVPLEDQMHVEFLQSALPGQNIYILDLGYEHYSAYYPSICQHYEHDIYQALMTACTHLEKYQHLYFVWGKSENIYLRHIRDRILQPIQKACDMLNITLIELPDLEGHQIESGSCYLLSYDFDLVRLVEQSREKNFNLGSDVGVISFNDTPLKRVVADGISTLSTDFRKMGILTAEMIKNHGHDHIVDPIQLIQRGSF